MMKPNFRTSFSVAQTPQQALEAIQNPRGWWSEAIEGPTEKPGDEFTYRYRDMHRCNVKVVELVPQKKVVWQVLDNYFSFIADKTEWKGTKLIFEISRTGDQTEIGFTHEGLVPDYECYELCSNAWGTYINGSLRRLITTGKGSPNPKEE